MQPTTQQLDSYATAPSPTTPHHPIPPSSNTQTPTAPNHEADEAQIRARACERYKHSPIRSDHHFNFHARQIALSTLHERKHAYVDLDQAEVDDLVLRATQHGWSHNLSPVTVSDDSIVPPDGPGTNLRSHLLPPTFSIVHGHLHVAALNEASHQGYPVPDMILVEVAVPFIETSMGDTEIRLLELSMRLNRFTPQTPPTPLNTPSRRTQASPQRNPTTRRPADDLRRLMALQEWITANTRFKKMALNNLSRGDVVKAASQAHKEGVMATERIQETHLKRYVRALLIFDHAPKAFELYKHAAQRRDPAGRNISIVTLSSALILRAEPALKVLLLECLYAHLDARRKKLRGSEDTIFLRNIIKLYDDLKNVAGELGYTETAFLNATVVLPNGENSSTDICTMREALIAVASIISMSTDRADVAGISIRLQEALRAAKKGHAHSPQSPDETDNLPKLTTRHASHQRDVLKLKRLHQTSAEEGGEETSSMSLARAHTQILRRKINICEESLNTASEESQAQLETQARAQVLRGERTPVKNTDCGHKRLGSPESLSIVRRKVLRRNGPIQSSELSPRNHRVVSLRDSDSTKKVNRQLLNSGEDIMVTALPACILKNDDARFQLSEMTVKSLRAELRTYSSERSCAPNGIYKEVHDSEAEGPLRRCLQFAAYWSDHRVAIEEKGYSQMELSSPLLTSSSKKFLKKAGLLHSGMDESKARDRNVFTTAENSTKRHHTEGTEFKTSLTCASEDFEVETPYIDKDQAVIGTALGVIAEWLGLYNVENGLPSHAMSETGCSLLLLPKGSEPRKPRLAFGLRSRNGQSHPWDPPKDPSYMFIVTADSGFPMWIWERSHVILSGPDELLPLIAKHAKPQRVFVRPRSIFLCRGDVIHAFGALPGNDHHPAKPAAVLSYLVRRSVDRLGKSMSDGWWMKYIPMPDC